MNKKASSIISNGITTNPNHHKKTILFNYNLVFLRLWVVIWCGMVYTRCRRHLFAKPMHRIIDINLVTKIEYSELETQADMFLYEIYYINKLKPQLNSDDKAIDDLTIELPDIIFSLFETKLWHKWKAIISEEKQSNIDNNVQDIDKRTESMWFANIKQGGN